MTTVNRKDLIIGLNPLLRSALTNAPAAKKAKTK